MIVSGTINQKTSCKPKAAYWDGKNEAGEQVASGIYFYTIQAGEYTSTKKMVIAK